MRRQERSVQAREKIPQVTATNPTPRERVREPVSSLDIGLQGRRERERQKEKEREIKKDREIKKARARGRVGERERFGVNLYFSYA